MFQVLLVDDEAAAAESLQYGIDWQTMNLHLSYVAQNGLQALRYIQDNPVDIVITDIRMPDLDGLSLCQQIHQMNRNIQIIIISGFAEFSYAQKALSYGVIGYCLKPVEYAEITRYLQSAIRRIKKDSSAATLEDLLESLYQHDEDGIRACLSGFGFHCDRYYVSASFSKGPVLPANDKTLVLRMGHRRYGYISTVPFFEHDILSCLSVNDCKGFSYTNTASSIGQLESLLQQTSNDSFRFFFEPDKNFFVSQIPKSAFLELSDFPIDIRKSNAKHLTEFLQQVREIPSYRLNLRFAWHLYTAFSSHEVYGVAVGLDDIYSPEHLVFRFHSFHNMLDVLCERLRTALVGNRQERLSNTTFLHMMKYIDEHLSDNCSLQQLARDMNMNANYVGQIFKRETGQNFSSYVVGLRIERAKNLLQQGDLSISDIATALGFNDYFYFLKTFKRITGLTPKQYRSKCGAC